MQPKKASSCRFAEAETTLHNETCISVKRSDMQRECAYDRNWIVKECFHHRHLDIAYLKSFQVFSQRDFCGASVVSNNRVVSE
jgi:hypothetical protein